MNSERTQLCADIIITAVEGGIGYWSQVSEYRHDYNGYSAEETAVIVHEYCDGEKGITRPINVYDIDKVIKVIQAQTYYGTIATYIRSTIHVAAGENDASYIDAEVADVIFQIAMFGKLRYG